MIERKEEDATINVSNNQIRSRSRSRSAAVKPASMIELRMIHVFKSTRKEGARHAEQNDQMQEASNLRSVQVGVRVPAVLVCK